MFGKNEGVLDRIIRLILGLIFVYVSYGFGEGKWLILGYLLGAILILTGFTGFCGLYKIFGINTCKKCKEPKKKKSSKRKK